MPTTDEILSRRPPHMPAKDPTPSTRHRSGMARMLDLQFRHLRYDTFEPVIDACYHASQHLHMTFKEPPPVDYKFRQQTARGTQYSLFRDVRLEDLRFEQEGIHMRLSFACPAALRHRRLITSGHFGGHMLVALIGLNSEAKLSTTFCTVEMCQSTLAMKPITGDHLRAAVLVSFTDPLDTGAVRQALLGLKGISPPGRFVLVEFPRVLTAGFHWILKILQKLDNTNTAIAFADFIATPSAQPELYVPPPAYPNTEHSKFDLSPLEDSFNSKSCSAPKVGLDFLEMGLTEQEVLIEDICSATTLDRGQAAALCESLSRGLAFTQGPPGTGKTFLGAALAKVILKHVPKKPILVACMTNHALDNFLNDLLKQGITKVARLGGGSKEDWADKYTLASLRKNFKSTSVESTKVSKAYQNVKALSEEGTRCCESLNSCTLTWAAVRDHLKRNYHGAFQEFVKCQTRKEEQIEDIRKKRSAAGGFAFEHWCQGGDLADIRAFARELGAFFGKTKPGTNLSDDSGDHGGTFSGPEAPDPVDPPCGDFDSDAWSMPLSVRTAWIARWKSELGSSSNISRLAEVQRRYTVARDNRQEVYGEVDARCLADQEVIGLTTTACAKYWSLLKSLDLHTLICEEAGEIMEAQTISTLLPSIKHAIFIGDPLQLRPQINQRCLSLETTYGGNYRMDESLFERMVMPRNPGVQPLPASKLSLQRRMHPDVADLMRVTLYPYLEDHPSTSRLPVAGMAQRTYWLDHQEPEDDSDPLAGGGRSYSNQFECDMISELVRYLINTDRDKENLADLGLLDDLEQQQFRMDVEVLPMVRLATIDSFQGEEAKVIILSIVRSNLEDRVGFLQTINRINVACSRARNGFYIVGNSTLLRTVDMWKSIINNFQTKGRIGTFFTTQCSRHPHLIKAVSLPQHFEEVTACEKPCRHVFDCGHQCTETCHEPTLHSRMRCEKPCNKRHIRCGHQCTKTCGEPCGDCVQIVSDDSLPCGHKRFVKCADLERDEVKPAAHNVDLSINAVTNAVVSVTNVKRKDFIANVWASAAKPWHVAIPAQTTVILGPARDASNDASDLASMAEHVASLVTLHVIPVCEDAKLPVHMGIAQPCVRCPADEYLAAYHAISYYLARTYARGFAAKIFLPCGHDFSVAYLDFQLGLDQIFDLSPSGEILTLKRSIALASERQLQCPQCKSPCDGVQRYRHFEKFQAAPANIERLYKLFGRKLQAFAEEIQTAGKDLENSFKLFCKQVEPGPLQCRANVMLVKARMLYIMPTQSKIVRFRDEIVRGAEEDIAHTLMILGDIHTSATPLLPFECRLDLLYFHCRLTMLREATRSIGYLSRNDSSTTTNRVVADLQSHIIRDVIEAMQVIEMFTDRCRTNHFKRLETEAILIRACITKLLEDLQATSEAIGADICNWLRQAETLIVQYPDTAGLHRSSFDAVKRHWEGSKTITADLWTLETRKLWIKWGEFEVGNLVYCEKGHPYSNKSFSSCPECGRKVMPRDPESQADFERNLDRDNFLRVMKKHEKLVDGIV
ncbi:MAG: hypothetical protein Q9219_004531 [cf. Caloplaca sp. 3 TL-2023]